MVMVDTVRNDVIDVKKGRANALPFFVTAFINQKWLKKQSTPIVKTL